AGRWCAEEPDHRHRRLLRICGNRPNRCRGSKSFDEISPAHAIIPPKVRMTRSVRSIADCIAGRDVRFRSDRESGFPQTAMSALPPKADMCGALAYVRFGPIADINHFSERRGMS